MTVPFGGPSVPDYDEVWSSVYGDMQAHGPVHRHLGRLVRAELARLSYESVLDVGCGPGHNFSMLAAGRELHRLGGVDISSAAIERARAEVGGDFTVADVQHEIPAGSWDLVHCSLVMEHLPDDVAALRNLRPAVGRHLLLTTIAGDFERYRRWEERVGHVRNYRRGELEAKLSATGYRVDRSIYWGWPLYSPLMRRMQNRSAVGTGEYNRMTRLAASIVHAAYFANSRRRGDLLIVVAEPA